MYSMANEVIRSYRLRRLSSMDLVLHQVGTTLHLEFVILLLTVAVMSALDLDFPKINKYFNMRILSL